jgi:heterodisulfide reductase subunit D
METLAARTNAWACYDCGKCTATCPIARSGSSYSPRRQVLATNLGQEGELVSSDGLFTCLTCSLCDLRCPAQVDYTTLVQQLRELAHGADREPECPHGGALQSVMRMMAKGGTKQDRLGWLDKDLHTRPAEGEVFYWTGCAPYYDAFFSELQIQALAGVRAAVKVFNALGVEPVVSSEERCCGHDLLWNGDRTSFEALAERNVALVKASGAKTLVTSCAECARTWRLDYEPYLRGVNLQVQHLSEYLLERLGELPLDGGEARRITFQDPCRLGRHLGVYDPPRQVLGMLPGVELAEMRHSRAGATCCAGSTWSSCDRFAKKIQVERLREARSTGAEVLVTACPKCQIHFRCAMKDPNIGGDLAMEMKDIAEIVAESLK